MLNTLHLIYNIIVRKKNESQEVKKLFKKLCKEDKYEFPENGSPEAIEKQGVYIIREGETVLHVGRTKTAKNGINQRLEDHLSGTSSFAKNYLKKNQKNLRNGNYTYQFLEVDDDRKRALLEAYTIGVLCPEHIGLG
jgi:predicted GIY-YIG superfamily endonuclease